MGKIIVIQGDITQLCVDAVVNAANRSLQGGGGVDGAIHRAAGPELLKSCQLLNGCQTGEAKITPGFGLPSGNVIHTVGPVWQNGTCNEKQLLASCYNQSLRVASENNLRTIAFPNISTGIYGFPKQLAAVIAVETVNHFLNNNPQIEQVIFCCFDDENHKIYTELLSQNAIIQKVVSPPDIQIIADLAARIWNEYYVPIIGEQQVDYMVKNFQSAVAIENQIYTENYEYFIIYNFSEPSGYIAIKRTGDDLFLSKFYIIKEKRGTGLGRKGFEFIYDKAKVSGAGRITLTVNKNNINSIKAYEKLGFKNDGPVVADIGSGYIMDDFKMSCEIVK